ncbi:MAG: hypothetical protein KC502_06955 [Myxococcales bacterium]|nr:hypothetical protein [Myxococcales bacterium]
MQLSGELTLPQTAAVRRGIRTARALLTVCAAVLLTTEANAVAPTATKVTTSPDISHRAGKGIKFIAPSGAWLSLRPRVMLLYHRDQPEQGKAAHALTLRRARFIIKSGMPTLHLSSKLELAFSSRDLRFSGGHPRQTPVLTWSVAWTQWRDLRVKVGQFKIGYSRQRLISSGNLQMVDRSAVQGEFTLDRDIGVELYSDDLGGLGVLRYVVGVYNGEGRDVYQLSTSPPMVLARLEFLPFGKFDAYKEADLKRHRTPKLVIAVAGAKLDGAARDRGVLGSVPKDGETTDHTMMTADLHAKWRGLSLFVEGHARSSKRAAGLAPGRSGWGVVSTLGWMLPLKRDIELSARFGQITGAPDSAVKDLREIGGGLSWYLSGHANKIQADVTQLSSEGSDDLRFRLQLQVSM